MPASPRPVLDHKPYIIFGPVIVCLLIIIGMLFRVNQNLTEQINSLAIVPNPTATPSLPPPGNGTINQAFDTYLAERCYSPDSYFAAFTLDPRYLPFDLSLFWENTYKDSQSITCFFNDSQKKNGGYLVLQRSAGDVMYIYGPASLEPGHDGPPIFANYGTVWKTTDDTTIAIYVSANQSRTFLSDTTIRARITKSHLTEYGETIFLSQDDVLIGTGNAQLIAALQPFSTRYENNSELDFSQQASINAAVVKHLTSLPDTHPAKQKLAEMEALFESF